MTARYAWYAAYASNLARRRFRLYIEGGHLPENKRDHAGARDRAAPVSTRPLILPGTMYFATESATWGGGRALYDPDAPGLTLGRGYLITEEQLLDVVAQEMRLEPGTYSPALLPRMPGTSTVLGSGHYETLACTGAEGEYPVYTMAAPWPLADVSLMEPSESYRTMIILGLMETWALTPASARSYLNRLPGGIILRGDTDELDNSAAAQA